LHSCQANGAIDTATITKAGAGFKSLTDAWADTTTAHGRLMLTVLGGLAEFERELILARNSTDVEFQRPEVASGRPLKCVPCSKEFGKQAPSGTAKTAKTGNEVGFVGFVICRIALFPKLSRFHRANLRSAGNKFQHRQAVTGPILLVPRRASGAGRVCQSHWEICGNESGSSTKH